MKGFKAAWLKSMESFFYALEAGFNTLEACFNTSTGHDHDGSDAKKIPFTSIDPAIARSDGQGGIFVFSATFDPKGTAGHRTVAAHDLGVDVPADMLVIGGCVDVLETLADGASDAATIAIHVVGANDIVSAVAIATAGDAWDQGRHDIVPDGTGSTAVKTTEASAITATVGTHALTAGKAVIYLYCIPATANVAA